MSEALIELTADDIEDWPKKLRLAAALAGSDIAFDLSPESARDLANWIDHGLRADVRIDRERAEAEAAVVLARQHVAEVELLARLWAVMAVAACAVAAVILLLRV
jgi:hypothetical protein